jgi:hypothetical protein
MLYGGKVFSQGGRMVERSREKINAFEAGFVWTRV